VQLDPARTTTLIHSDPALAPLNLTGFASEQADELSEQLTASSDPAERAELLNEIQVLIAEEVPFVTLLYADGAYAYWSTVYADWAFIAGQGVVNKLSFLAPEARP
jgi:ABC-type transport system substrate-binding protein